MATAFLATHVESQREVALKVLRRPSGEIDDDVEAVVVVRRLHHVLAAVAKRAGVGRCRKPRVEVDGFDVGEAESGERPGTRRVVAAVVDDAKVPSATFEQLDHVRLVPALGLVRRRQRGTG